MKKQIAAILTLALCAPAIAEPVMYVCERPTWGDDEGCGGESRREREPHPRRSEPRRRTRAGRPGGRWGGGPAGPGGRRDPGGGGGPPAPPTTRTAMTTKTNRR